MVKVGDKVRIVNSEYDRGESLTVGKTYKVTFVEPPHYEGKLPVEVRDNNGDTTWLYNDEFEVVRVEDYRTSNPGLHSLHVDNAKRVLSAIETALRDLDEMSLVDASLVAGTLRKERASLVANNTAYMDAAAILYVGEDWLKEAE